ncbi:MAG: hypothetical protein LCH73_02500 [Proteobacteria bacterium]|nr:hypothetical protein [Pseudomonadota bacterium]
MTTAARLLCTALLAAGAAHAAARDNDFPTNERVQYVLECMANNPGSQFEMVSKCSCALDKMAEELSYEQYLTLSTEFKAATIGGERGAVIRDNNTAQKDARRYRDLQKKVQSACFINAR